MKLWSGKPRFFWVALLCGVLASSAWVFHAVNLFLYGRYQKVIGWTAVPQDGAWRIANVTPGGPAAGKLQPGDRLIAIDGDRRAERTGPLYRLLDMPPDRVYPVAIERQGRLLTETLSFRVVPDHNGLAWGLLFLFISLAYLVNAMLLGLVKPDDPTARNGFYVSILVTLFMLCVAANMLNGLLHGFRLYLWLAMYSVIPLHLLFGYLFLAGFPEVRPEQGAWRLLRAAMVVFACVLWVPGTLINFIHALGPDRASELIHRYWGAYIVHRQFLFPAQSLFLSAASIASLAVGYRNYKRLAEGDLRRRLRWVAWGFLASTVPLIAGTLIWGVIRAAGAQESWGDFVLSMTRVTNGLVVIMPVTMSYAILKHRVLGIQVVIRMGLQYLLASHSLRVIVFLPVAAFLYVIATSPDKTIGELLFHPAARFNLGLLVLAAISLRYRRQLSTAIDRRFFREAYQREQILVRLADRIRNLDTVAEVSETLSREVQAALHPKYVMALYHADHRQAFSLVYSTAHRDAALELADSTTLVKRLEQSGHARDVHSLRSGLPAPEAAWLDAREAHLIVPILGTQQNLLGILLLGEKQSEEPYTAKDRGLLEAIASQIGVLWENFALRQRVHREREVQDNVLAKLQARDVNLVKECPACGYCYDSAATHCPRDNAELALTLPVERVVDGKYRLDRLVGRGGMGAVYEAHDLRLARRVAVKVMTGALFGDAAAVRRFAREARASAKLDHPNIVRVHDFGELSGNGAYLVLEYVAGASWRAYLRKTGPFPPHVAAARLDQLFRGVAAAHEAGIVHRDLKPDNILIAGQLVKILDFGLAKVRESGFTDPKSMTVAGAVMGTPGYMAPEQLAGEEVDERADIYALGVISLETLVGELGLRGLSFHEQINRAVIERFQFPGATSEHAAVAAVLGRALALKPPARTATVGALRGELIPLLRSCRNLNYARQVTQTPGGEDTVEIGG